MIMAIEALAFLLLSGGPSARPRAQRLTGRALDYHRARILAFTHSVQPYARYQP